MSEAFGAGLMLFVSEHRIPEINLTNVHPKGLSLFPMLFIIIADEECPSSQLLAAINYSVGKQGRAATHLVCLGSSGLHECGAAMEL